MSDRAPLRILCFGNPLHGDDGYGPAVALALRRQLPGGAAEIVDCGTRGLDALHWFENCPHVVIVDAMAGQKPGTVRLLQSREITVENHLGGHGAGVGYLLEAVRQTLAKPPLVDVVATEIGPVSAFSPGLSLDIAAAVAETVALIRERFLPPADGIAAELSGELAVLREANLALEGELIQSAETMELLIGEQEKQQDELRRRTQELTQLHGTVERAIGTMAEIFIMLGPDGKVTRVNALFEQELGYPTSSIVGAYLEDCLPESSLRQLRRMLPSTAQPPLLLNAIRAAGGRFSAEMHFRPTGSPTSPEESRAIPYLVHASLLHSQAGKLEGAVVVATNISALESREQALRDNERQLHETAEELRDHRDNLARMVDEQTRDLRDAMHQAEAASRAKSNFLSNMSHEVRTPLNAILGLSDLCLLTPLNSLQEQHIGKIRLAADHLLGIINDILDFSRIEAGKLSIEKLCFDLPAMLDEITDLLIGRIEEKGLELCIDVAPAATRSFIGDPLRLKQVIINLLGNAIKFSPQGVLRVGCAVDSSSAQQAELHFHVKDEGIGISPEQQEGLFSAFCQADSSTTRRYGGSGLGLAISKRLVELMGGRIWLDSAPGQGSTFHFTVQLGAAEVSPPAAEFSRTLAEFAGQPILIAANNPWTAEALGGLCRQLGFTVETHASGETALAALRRADRDYPVALLDWQMASPNGPEIMAALRAQPTGRRQPKFIIISSLSATSSSEAGGISADALLLKPGSLHRLYAALAKALALTNRPRPPAAARGPDLSGIHLLKEADILVVDDIELNRDLMGELFATAGLKIRLASNGAEAIAMVQAKKPDLILMDCQMPVMDGFTATRRLRELPEYADLPIVALTAGALEHDRAQSFAAGMNAYVTKPVNLEKLLHLIAELLSSRPGTPSPSVAPPPTPPTPPSPPPVRPDSPADGRPLPELPGIDIAAGMARVRNKVDFYRRMLIKFRDNHAADLAGELQRNVDSGQRPEAVRAAHSLKGIALSLGIDTLGEVAASTELALKDPTTPPNRAQIVNLLAELEKVRHVLQALG